MASSTYVGDIAGWKALGYPGQRKVVRDNSGYWYAVWGAYVSSQHRIYMSKSTNTTGTAWSTPTMLVGNGGLLRSTANQLYFPSIAIDRVNNKLHLVWQEGTSQLFYSRLVDLTKWNNASYWYSVQESYNGAQVIVNNTFSAADANLAPSIAVDAAGSPHILFFHAGHAVYLPFYLYAPAGSDFNSVLYLVGVTTYAYSYGSIDIDGNGKVYAVAYRDTKDICVWTIESPYTSKTGPTSIIGSSGNALKYSSIAIDSNNKVYVATLEETDNDIWTAYYDGSSWAETENMDTASWQNPDVGVRTSTKGPSHLIVAPTTGSTPESIHYWEWSGSSWGQPEADSGEDADDYISLEQKSPSWADDQGLLYFDDNGSTDAIYFTRITGRLRTLLVYSEYDSSNDDIIRSRGYTAGDWGAEGTAYDTNDSGALRWHTAASSADGKKQVVLAVGTGSNTLYASLYDGSSWTSTSLGAIYTSSYRCFAAAYEQQSGQLVVAAATNTTNQIKYWVHDGSTWVVDGSTHTFNDSDGLYAALNWLRMDARPDSNQIAMILRSNANHAGGLIWDGEANAWGNDKKLSISGATPTADNLCNADVKYMRAGPYKGQAVFVWPNNNTTIYGWIWTGGAWESAYKSKTSAVSGSTLWVELAADPNSSQLLAALGDSNDDLYTVDWTGSSWGTARSVSTDLLSTTWYGRRYAVSFESGTGHTGHAVIAYSDSANLKYRHTSDITGAWGSETNVDASYDCNFIELARDEDNNVHLVCQEEDGPDDLIAYVWNNTSWASEGILETDLQYDGNGVIEAFAIVNGAGSGGNAAPTIGSGPLLGFSQAADGVMRYSIWDGSNFSAAEVGPTFASTLDWVVVETAPTGKLMVGGTNGGALYASFYDGSAWGPVKTLQASGGSTIRFFDAAVETNSGQILVVAGSGTDLKYWVYDRGAWVVDGSTITGLSLGSSNKYFVELASDPNSNEIALVFADSSADAYGAIWDGDANTWGNAATLETSLSTSNNQPVGVAYIATGTGAGQAMFVWGAPSGYMGSRIWNGSSWDSELTDVAIGGGANWVRLKADPSSNKLVFGAQRGNYTFVVVIWDGSAWGSATTVESALFGSLNGYPTFDVIFEKASGHASDILVVYSDTANLRYQHVDWNGSSYSWGSETDISTSYDVYWSQLQYAADDKILLAVRDNAEDLNTWSWDNSSWTFEKEVSTSLQSSSQSHMPFYLSPGYFATSGGLTQAHYRWRNDDGSESAATFALAEDNKMGVAKETPKRLRFLVKNTGAYATAAFQLQAAETATCSSGSYTVVGGGTGAGAHWSLAASSYLTDGGTTSNVASGLTDPASMSFAGGQVKESAATTGTINIDTSAFVEIEFSIQADSAATAEGDYCFRLHDAGQGAALYAYTNYAEAQVLGVTAVRLLEFAAQGAGSAVEVLWRTGQEVRNKGFDLYRAESPGGPYAKLNAGLIPSASESGEGRSYRFVDATALPGRLYYYRLEDVDTRHTHTPHGPVCVDWDADGLADDWEIAHGLNPQVNDAGEDPDGDGSPNGLEFRRGTDPLNRDSDGDGVLDGAEQKGPSTGPAGGALGAGVQVLSAGEGGMILELATADFDAAKVVVDGQEFERLSIAGYVHGYTRAVGEPELPVKGVLIAVPEGKRARLEVLSDAPEVLGGYRVYPVPERFPGEAGELREFFAWQRAAYAEGAVRPSVAAELSSAYVFRGQVQQRVLFYPLRFEPQAGALYFSRRIRVKVEFVEAPAAALSAHRPALAAFSPGAGAAYKLSVAEEGIYRISRDYLLGQGIAGADIDAIDLSTVQLFHLGVEQAIAVEDADRDGVLGAGDYIGFYATGVPADYAKYSKFNVYWLADRGSPNALRMPSAEGRPAGGPLAASHTASVHYELNQSYLQAAPGADGMERWIFSSVAIGSGIAHAQAGQPKSFTLSLPGALGPGDLLIRMYGPYEMAHEASVLLNGAGLGRATWSGIGYTEAEFAAVSFVAGENTVAVTCESGADRTGFDWFKALYERDFAAASERLKFTHAGGFRYELTGFSTAEIELFEVSDPAAVKRVVNGSVSGAGPYALEVEPAGAAGEKRYYAVAAGGILSPASAVKDTPSDLQSGANAADWILITHGELGWENGVERNWVRELVSLRQSQGLRTAVVDVADIMDEFGYGLESPQAIRAFLTHAFENWTPPAPRYVLLMGDTTYDYLDNRALGTVNHVPGYLVYTAHLGETVTDDWYGRVSGEDSLCDLSIGRLPAQTAGQAEAMAAKLIAYESAANTKSWQKRTVFTADNAPENWEQIFEVMSEEGIARLLAGMGAAQRFYLQEYENELLSVGDLSADLTAALNAGALILHYSGHANVNIWATEKILDNSTSGGREDVNGLSNEGMYPFVVGMACLSGYFIYPSLGAYSSASYLSLAEGFMRPQQRGAIAALLPSGMTEVNGQRALSNALMEAIFSEDKRRLGDAVAAAKQALLANAADGYAEVAETFVFFGDPATELKVPLPRRPQGLTAREQAGGVALAWSAALGCNGGAVSGYHVYRRSSRESGYRRLTESAVATAAFTDPTAALQASAALADAHAYTYAVSAVDADGDEGALSAPVTVSLSSPDAGSPPPASAGGGCFIAAAEENPCSQWLEALIGWAMMAAAGLMRFGRRYR